MKRRNIRLIRDYLRTLQDKCAYCLKPLDKVKLVTVDHVIPRADNGATSIFNSVLACSHCNTKKGSSRKEPLIRPEVSMDSWKKFIRKVQKECPDKYWSTKPNSKKNRLAMFDPFKPETSFRPNFHFEFVPTNSREYLNGLLHKSEGDTAS